MYLKRTQRSRLKNQWRFLSKQLKQLTEQGKFQQLTAAKRTFLLGRLKQLFQQMLRFEKAGKLKKALGAAALLIGLQATPLQAQVTFAPTVNDPFGLSHSGSLALSTLVDIDGDGDLDIISVQADYYSDEQTFDFRENMSTNEGTTSNFAAAVQDYAGLTLPDQDNFTYNNPEFGDLDNDGDLDLFIGAYEDVYFDGLGQIVYFENTGDANNPAFAEPVINPFNIDLNESTTSIPKLVDLDGDGDLDLMDILVLDNAANNTFIYLENIGTAEAPSFAAAQEAPFGLPVNADELSLPDFGDIDNDGDIDIISGGIYNFYSYEPAPLTFLENIGTANNPQFGVSVANPFSLESPAGFLVWPMLGDLDNDGDLDILTDGGYDYDSYGIFWTFQENLLDPVAVKETRLAAIATVFPSVSNSLVNLNVETEAVQSYFQIGIFSMSGELLNQHKIAGGTTLQHQIDLSNYPAGQYLIQVRTPEGVLMRKAIKQ